MTATETMDAQYGLEQNENVNKTEGSFALLSTKYNNMINVLFTQNHIASVREVHALESQLQSVRNNMHKIEEAHDTFDTVLVPLMLDQIQRKKQSTQELQIALDGDVISKDSYDQWIAWLEDSNRDSTEKTDSMNGDLRDYLEKRRPLAARRERTTNSNLFIELKKNGNQQQKDLCKQLEDTSYFLNVLSFHEREDLIIRVLAEFPILEADQKLFTTFSKNLDAVVGKYISTDAKNRWIARFNDPSAKSTDREKFVMQEFPNYVKNWEKIHKEYTDLKSQSITATLTKKDITKIDNFQSPEKFIKLGYKEKVNLVKEVQNAVKAKTEGKEKIFQEIKEIVHAAAQAQYVSEHSTGSLVSRMMQSNRTPKEVEGFAKNWAKVRFRYDEVERKINDTKIPQGFNRLSKSTFLGKKYKEREKYVKDAEERLDIESRPLENTPFANAKGKVRHALDNKNWAEAEIFLHNAWPLASSEKDQLELKSMERYLHAFKNTESNDDEKDTQSVSDAVQEISSSLSQLPAPMRAIYEEALKYNAGCVWTLGVTAANVQWCLVRGYLPRDLDSVRDTARVETKSRIETRQGHSGGVENTMVDDFDRPAINEEPTGAQNFCVSSSKASLIAETANANQNNINYWYWTNLIVKGVSAGEYENVANNLRHKLTRSARTLEANGVTYQSAITAQRSPQIPKPIKATEADYSLAS